MKRTMRHSGWPRRSMLEVTAPRRLCLRGSANSFGAAEDVTLVGLSENGLVHRETPSAGEEQRKEPRQINESKFAAVFAAERQLVHEEKRDAEIDRQNERSQARNQSDGQQRRAENLGERREAKADRMAQADRVGELRRHLRKAFQLREAVIEKNRKTEPQPQCKQGKVRQQRILFGSEDLLEHGISRLRLAGT